jgi:ATP-binding cassette, subfamily C, bacteriocin exporter
VWNQYYAYQQESLGKIIGIVPQNLDLFSGNITENVAVGEYNPDISRILSIFGQLGMLDFIEKLPAGLNTWIGEHGATLSGGQKQKIAIARALYRDPQFLILDEATSSLDSESEYYIQQTIERFRSEGKTVLVIAHRLSTVVKADNIVVLQTGKVTEQGSHSQLWNQKGIYYSMWQKQLPFPES